MASGGRGAVPGSDRHAGSTDSTACRGVDDLTTARLYVHEFVVFSANHPQIHRIITQECKSDGPRMDWLVERFIRPLYDATGSKLFARLVEQGRLPDIGVAHLYYLLTGAGPTMFVLGPECRRLTGGDRPRPIRT